MYVITENHKLLYTENGINYEAIETKFDVAFVVSGHKHVFAIDYNGNLYGKGDNEFGQLGLGPDKYFDNFTCVNFLPKITHVSISNRTSVARDENGQVYVCGIYYAFKWPDHKGAIAIGINEGSYVGHDNTFKIVPQSSYVISALMMDSIVDHYHCEECQLFLLTVNSDGILEIDGKPTDFRDVETIFWGCENYDHFYFSSGYNICSVSLRSGSRNYENIRHHKFYFNFTIKKIGNDSVFLTDNNDLCSYTHNDYPKANTDYSQYDHFETRYTTLRKNIVDFYQNKKFVVGFVYLGQFVFSDKIQFIVALDDQGFMYYNDDIKPIPDIPKIRSLEEKFCKKNWGKNPYNHS